jgi:hypothetical protein
VKTLMGEVKLNPSQVQGINRRIEVVSFPLSFLQHVRHAILLSTFPCFKNPAEIAKDDSRLRARDVAR